MAKINIEIKETGKEMPQRLRDFLASEVERLQILETNENGLEKEVKEVIQWVVSVRKRRGMLVASMEPNGKKAVIFESGKVKNAYKSSKEVNELKTILDYINENVCDTTTAIKNINIQPNKNNTFSLIFYFKN